MASKRAASPQHLPSHPKKQHTEHRETDVVHTEPSSALWGPYLSERHWGTVREDYSKDGNCWEYFSHEAATYRAYSSGEDGLMGICDDQARLCLAVALWNGKDKMLKERLYGLTQPQGNHAEDVKECYYYLDATPDHSYLKALYKYPHKQFPYEDLLTENTRRGLEDPEYELLDTGIFAQNRYWDVEAEYAKSNETDMVCRYTVHNRGPDTATIHVLPTLWFRNTWSSEANVKKPEMRIHNNKTGTTQKAEVECSHEELGDYVFRADPPTVEGKIDPKAQIQLLMTENETNSDKLHGLPNTRKWATKDALHEYVIKGSDHATMCSSVGTKCAALYRLTVPGGGSASVTCQLYDKQRPHSTATVSDIITKQKEKADKFYSQLQIMQGLTEEKKNIARQACAGLIWTKQFFCYDVHKWFHGCAHQKNRINCDWRHMKNHDVISMPDKWEFPWYATWDLAFHMVAFADLDLEFAKQQLLLLLSDRYMHPNGQLPAYEFNFSDVNPPVHAWAVWVIYEKSGQGQKVKDITFLKKAFHRLMLNFNWWVNSKSIAGSPYLYEGGFLGMDNISVIHRSLPPKDTTLIQADGTGWMAFYSLCLFHMAAELAHYDDVYSDLTARYLDSFVNIADALNSGDMWDDKQGFFYDIIRDSSGVDQRVTVESMVGLVPLFATHTFHEEDLKARPAIQQALAKLQCAKPHLVEVDSQGNYLLSVVPKVRLLRILQRITSEDQFLSPHGVRALSKVYTKPYSMTLGDETYTIQYCPGESNSDMFGGNSNWRGPVWICMNYLLLSSLQEYAKFYGEKLTIPYPASSKKKLGLKGIAQDISDRIVKIFVPDKTGRRPCHGDQMIYANDENWSNLVLFYEYYHGDTGRGCGASHQTGWSALVLQLLGKGKP